MKKVGATLLLSSSIFFSGLNVHAAGTGDNPSFTEDVATEAQVKAFKEKESLVKEYMKEQRKHGKEDGVVTNALPDGKYKVISVPSFKQETSYWCGPATVKQVLDFLNGSSNSQSYYASKLGTTTDGTDFSKVDDVLNAHQSVNTYVYASISDYSTWSSRIEYNTDKNIPTVLDLKIDPKYMPKYTAVVEGHILNVSGYDTKYSSTAQIRLTDPYDQGNRGVTLGNVWHPHSGVYQCNNLHFRKAMIW